MLTMSELRCIQKALHTHLGKTKAGLFDDCRSIQVHNETRGRIRALGHGVWKKGRLDLVIGAIWLRWIGPAWCIKFWEGMGLGLIKSQSGMHGMITTMNEDNELLGYNGSF